MTIRSSTNGGVATLVIDRQKTYNALDIATQNALREALIAARDDNDVRVVLITGAGDKAFSAGADLKSTPPSDAPYATAWNVSDSQAAQNGGYIRLLNLDGLRIWKPMIAAINGYCLGGGFEVALQCDLRVASSNASFALPEVRVGSLAGVCGSLLLRTIPSAHAMKMLLTGARVDAEEALRIGLVSDVWPQEELMDRATELAQQIAANAPLSLAATKRLARDTDAMSRCALFDMTEMAFGLLTNTDDRAEGRRAFAEKRPPRFVGR